MAENPSEIASDNARIFTLGDVGNGGNNVARAFDRRFFGVR
jgi:hypothetical protein